LPGPKAYLLTFYQSFRFAQSDIDFLDSTPEVMNWFIFPPSIFIVSEHSAYDLSAIFREQYPEQHFIVSQIVRGDNDGWLPQEIWDFINNPQPGRGKGPKLPQRTFGSTVRDLLKAIAAAKPGEWPPALEPIPPTKKKKRPGQSK
jgi:hypothetical protein